MRIWLRLKCFASCLAQGLIMFCMFLVLAFFSLLQPCAYTIIVEENDCD